jgi:hypothetical protein
MRTAQKVRVQTRQRIELHIAVRRNILRPGTELISHAYQYNSLHMARILLPEIVSRKWRHLLHVLSRWGRFGTECYCMVCCAFMCASDSNGSLSWEANSGPDCEDLLHIYGTHFHNNRSWDQYSETDVMHFTFSLLRIRGLYMFRTLLAHPQDSLHKRHLVQCVRVRSVGCTTPGAANWHNTHALYQLLLVYDLLRMSK